MRHPTPFAAALLLAVTGLAACGTDVTTDDGGPTEAFVDEVQASFPGSDAATADCFLEQFAQDGYTGDEALLVLEPVQDPDDEEQVARATTLEEATIVCIVPDQ